MPTPQSDRDRVLPPLPAGAGSAAGDAAAVLDFDPRDADEEATARTRRLLDQTLASQGAEGLLRVLHVDAPRAAQLKHRVACVTCRSRLDALTLSLATAGPAAPGASASSAEAPDCAEDCLAPLNAWLAADSGRGLAPTPEAAGDLDRLAAFLANFGSSEAGGDDTADEPPQGRRRGGAGGVVRCPLHATGAAAAAPSTRKGAMTEREMERFVALLRCSTTESEWRRLSVVDVDGTMCDLFSWLGGRGLCAGCVDVVTGALLEVRRVVASGCKCSRCLALPGDAGSPEEEAVCREISYVDRGPSPGPPEMLRVQGRLRAVCGVFRLEPLPFNGRPVYKKERSEAYLLHTSLKDWMISGKPDAGGSKCEGWAYVADPAETPEEICGTWKVSGTRGWEEDRSLIVTAFKGLPEELQPGLGYDDGSAVARHLTADERGALLVPLLEPEVLEEVLWAAHEPPPPRTKSGACSHIRTSEAAQRELQCWLRWLIRSRLEAQRRHALAQSQVGASLCRLFACAALQQLEQAAEAVEAHPPRGKKGRAKKDRSTGSEASPQALTPLQAAAKAAQEIVFGGGEGRAAGCGSGRAAEAAEAAAAAERKGAVEALLEAAAAKEEEEERLRRRGAGILRWEAAAAAASCGGGACGAAEGGDAGDPELLALIRTWQRSPLNLQATDKWQTTATRSVAAGAGEACDGAASAAGPADQEAVEEWRHAEGSCSSSVRSPSSPMECGRARGHRAQATGADSDGSASTRADSSEEPPDARRARLASGARRLMQQMGWRPEAAAVNKEAAAPLDGAEVAAWREQHPGYLQAVREERVRLRAQFRLWAGDSAADLQAAAPTPAGRRRRGADV